MFQKRIQSRIRVRYPILLPLVALIVGQIIGSLCYSYFSPSDRSHEIESWVFQIDTIRHPRIGERVADGTIVNCFTLHQRDCPYSGKILIRGAELPWKVWGTVRSGDFIQASGVFKPFQQKINPFSYESYMRRRGFIGTLKIKFSRIVATNGGETGRVIQRELNKVSKFCEQLSAGGLFLSMAFGVRDKISAQEEEMFRSLGLSHLLVFSGYQVVLLFWSINSIAVYLIRKILKRNLFVLLKIASVSVFCLVCFVVLQINDEHSTIRALIALAIFLIADLLERPLRFAQSICTALFVMNVWWPGCIFEPGVELTIAALIGISLTHKLKGFWGAIYGMAAIGLCTGCISLIWFGTASVIGFLANPLLAPLLSVITCNLGYLAAMLFIIGIDPNGYILGFLCSVINLIVELLSFIHLHFNLVLSPVLLGSLFLPLLSVVIIYTVYRWKVIEGT